MFSIGEFSKITGLSIKTLRFYDEQNLLKPSSVDESSGYRYYAAAKIETALVIVRLRELEFSLAQIAEMLRDFTDEGDILDYLERQREAIEAKAQHYRQTTASLDHLIQKEREARTIMQSSTFNVEEKTIEPMLVAGIRMQGRYSECGQGFAQLGRQFGRHICGKAMLLCYDTEYKENDADFEPCMPVRAGQSSDGISVRELPGGRCVTLVHKGTYDQLGRSYEKILAYARQHNYEIQSPTREVYIKGPGMIFKGNPEKYLTEIQMLIKG